MDMKAANGAYCSRWNSAASGHARAAATRETPTPNAMESVNAVFVVVVVEAVALEDRRRQSRVSKHGPDADEDPQECDDAEVGRRGVRANTTTTANCTRCRTKRSALLPKVAR